MHETEQGFILTRHHFDRQGHTVIELWLTTDKGPVKLVIEDELVILFVERDRLAEIKQYLVDFQDTYYSQLLSLKTFSHKPVAGLYFKNLNSFYDARARLQQAELPFYEGSIRLADRYLTERFIHAGVSFVGDKITHDSFIEYKNVRVKPAEYVPKFKVLSLDIECAADGELFCIGFYSQLGEREYQRVVMIGAAEKLAKKSPKDTHYIEWVDSEIALLQAFQQILLDFDPDIIIGWAVVNFDFRIIYQRAERHGLRLRIGRNQGYLTWRDSRTETNQGFIGIDGRVVIDGIAALKAESYNLPSFSLESVAQQFLGKGKSTEDVDNRLQTIIRDFHTNKTKLAEYNLQDCILVWEVFEHLRLLDFLIFRSQLTGLELDRAGGSVAAFTNLYLPRLHRQGYISPNLPADGGLASPGGYVMDSFPGLYKNVLVLDFKSLYPSIIRTFKIDPLGLVEGLKSPQTAIEGFRGALFHRQKHLLPDIITRLWQQRDQAKQDKDQPRSQAIKILMNSFYGVLGSGGCPFYDTRLASSITLRGHAIMQQTAKWIEAEGFQVIYGDTDSTFVLLGADVSDSKADEIGKTLASKINQSWSHLIQEQFDLPSHLEIEFETHFSRFLMPTIRGSETGSKKRYAGLVKKGHTESLVFKGLENVRTDWTELARKFQEHLYQLVFHDQDPTSFIQQVVNSTLAGKNNHELIYRKRLRRSLKSYQKNIPPHVKAARLADAENLKLGKQLRYQHKGWISYLMTVNGPQPIEYVTSTIDYQHYIDKQIEPIADAILPFLGMSFAQIVNAQLGLFE